MLAKVVKGWQVSDAFAVHYTSNPMHIFSNIDASGFICILLSLCLLFLLLFWLDSSFHILIVWSSLIHFMVFWCLICLLVLSLCAVCLIGFNFSVLSCYVLSLLFFELENFSVFLPFQTGIQDVLALVMLPALGPLKG